MWLVAIVILAAAGAFVALRMKGHCGSCGTKGDEAGCSCERRGRDGESASPAP